MIGSFLQVLSYASFLAPYKIVPGGVYDISIVVHYVTKDSFPFLPGDLSIGATALCFNIPLMASMMKKVGSSSGPKTIVTFLLIFIFTDSLSHFLIDPLMKNGVFIAAFYGGVILGLGVTCIFRARSTSISTDVLARVIANDSNLKASNMIIVLDSTIVLLSLIVFKDQAASLYSWFAIFIYGEIVGMLQTESPSRTVFIVSRKTQELKALIIDKMGMRGIFIHSEEMHQGDETEVIFTIAKRKNIPHLKGEVKEIDPNAFVSIMYASRDSPWSGT